MRYCDLDKSIFCCWNDVFNSYNVMVLALYSSWYKIIAPIKKWPQKNDLTPKNGECWVLTIIKIWWNNFEYDLLLFKKYKL